MTLIQWQEFKYWTSNWVLVWILWDFCTEQYAIMKTHLHSRPALDLQLFLSLLLPVSAVYSTVSYCWSSFSRQTLFLVEVGGKEINYKDDFRPATVTLTYKIPTLCTVLGSENSEKKRWIWENWNKGKKRRIQPLSMNYTIKRTRSNCLDYFESH